MLMITRNAFKETHIERMRRSKNFPIIAAMSLKSLPESYRPITRMLVGSTWAEPDGVRVYGMNPDFSKPPLHTFPYSQVPASAVHGKGFCAFVYANLNNGKEQLACVVDLRSGKATYFRSKPGIFASRLDKDNWNSFASKLPACIQEQQHKL